MNVITEAIIGFGWLDRKRGSYNKVHRSFNESFGLAEGLKYRTCVRRSA